MTRTFWLVSPLAVAIAFGGSMTASAEEEATRAWRLSATTGYEADRRVFGDTSVNSVPVVVRLDYEAWSVGFAASAVQIHGPSSVGRVKIGTSGTAALDRWLAANPLASIDDIVQATSYSGWAYGDSMVTLSRSFYDPESWLPFVELTAGLKIPTASTRKQHGTGKFDYLLQLDIAKTLGPLTAFAGAGYRLNGSSYQPGIFRLTDDAIDRGVDVALGSTYAKPDAIRVYDTAQTSVGFSYAVTESVVPQTGRDIPLQLGVMYNWQQNAVAGIGDTHELIPFLSVEWSRNVKIGPYLVIGLSKPAPDLGLAAQVTVTY